MPLHRSLTCLPSADLIEGQKLAVLCYDANGNDKIAKEIDTAMMRWTLAKSTQRGGCTAYKAMNPNDVIKLHESLGTHCP